MGEVLNFYPSSSDLLFESSSVCDTCGKKFSNTGALRLHRIKKHHQILSDGDKTLFSRDAEREDDTSSYYHCPEDVCHSNTVKFNAMRHLRQHYLRMHTTKNLVCECGRRFSLEKDRKYHKKARCPLRQDGGSSPIKPKSKNNRKRKRSPVPESSRGPVFPENSTVLVIVNGGNTQETIKEILNALKVTSTVGIQTSIPDPIPTTNTVSVGDASTEFCDFSGQYNAPLMETDYYYQEANPAVRDISTGTDFVPSYVNYPQEITDYGSYNYVPQPGSSNASMQQFPQDLQPSTRTFGTTTDDFSTHVTRDDFDMLRDIETQTFWESLEGNGLIENIQS